MTFHVHLKLSQSCICDQTWIILYQKMLQVTFELWDIRFAVWKRNRSKFTIYGRGNHRTPRSNKRCNYWLCTNDFISTIWVLSNLKFRKGNCLEVFTTYGNDDLLDIHSKVANNVRKLKVNEYTWRFSRHFLQERQLLWFSVYFPLQQFRS